VATKGHFLNALSDPFVANSGARQSPNHCHKSSVRAMPEPHAKYIFLPVSRVATNLWVRSHRPYPIPTQPTLSQVPGVTLYVLCLQETFWRNPVPKFIS
jgi:hypothetical protein